MRRPSLMTGDSCASWSGGGAKGCWATAEALFGAALAVAVRLCRDWPSLGGLRALGGFGVGEMAGASRSDMPPVSSSTWLGRLSWEELWRREWLVLVYQRETGYGRRAAGGGLTLVPCLTTPAS